MEYVISVILMYVITMISNNFLTPKKLSSNFAALTEKQHVGKSKPFSVFSDIKTVAKIERLVKRHFYG